MSVNIGIDLGTTSVIIYMQGVGLVLKEPSVVAVDVPNKKIIAVGTKAKQMVGKTPDTIKIIYPLKDGVISNYEMTEKMLTYFLKKSLAKHTIKKPKIVICVPTAITEVERHAVEVAAYTVGARNVYIIEEPIAAAIGSGIDISRPCGSLIVDIGGGTADIAVISLGGTVVSASVKVAGNVFDNAIVECIRKKYNIQIGTETAEKIKISIGSVVEDYNPLRMRITGVEITQGLPVNVVIDSNEIVNPLFEQVKVIINTIKAVLEKTPPDLCGDIYERGIVITGGGALINGLDELIKKEIGVEAVVAEDCINCVAIGTGKYLDYLDDANFVKMQKMSKKWKY